MRILHCADIHLDSRMDSNLDKVKAKERKSEILNTFVRMIEYASDNDVNIVLIAGDLFDTGKVSVTCRNIVSDALRAHSEIDFYIIRGNHDRNDFIELSGTDTNIHIIGEEWEKYSLSESKKVTLYAREMGEGDGESYARALILNPSDINIVMLHGQESESQVRDKAEIIPLRSYRNKGIDYMALGHIHIPRVSKLDERGVYVYSGCLEGRGFDECGERGFYIIDIDEKTRSVSHRFVSFAGRRLFHINVDVTGLTRTSQMINRIRTEIEGSSANGNDLLKIVLTGETEVDCEMDTDYIRKTFSEEYYFVKVASATKLHVDLASYAGDISLKGEFVRNVMSAPGLSEDEKSGIIRLGIKAIMGEEI